MRAVVLECLHFAFPVNNPGMHVGEPAHGMLMGLTKVEAPEVPMVLAKCQAID